MRKNVVQRNRRFIPIHNFKIPSLYVLHSYMKEDIKFAPLRGMTS